MNSELEDREAMNSLPEKFKDIYERHFKTIKTRVTQGKIKTIYHFLMTEPYNRAWMKRILDIIRLNHTSDIKLNVSFGYILENPLTDELRFFHPSDNNTAIFETPRLLRVENDYLETLEELDKEDLVARVQAQRPSSAWRVAKIVCIRIDVYRLRL